MPLAVASRDYETELARAEKRIGATRLWALPPTAEPIPGMRMKSSATLKSLARRLGVPNTHLFKRQFSFIVVAPSSVFQALQCDLRPERNRRASVFNFESAGAFKIAHDDGRVLVSAVNISTVGGLAVRHCHDGANCHRCTTKNHGTVT